MLLVAIFFRHAAYFKVAPLLVKDDTSLFEVATKN